MISWERLEEDVRIYQKREQSIRDSQRVEEEVKARRKSAESLLKGRIMEQRAKLEESRWETPEKAYQTLGLRLRELIDIANEYAQTQLRESQLALGRYGNWQFYYRTTRAYPLVGKLRRGYVLPSQFDFIDLYSGGKGMDGWISGAYTWEGTPGWLFQLRLNGRPVLLDRVIESDRFELEDQNDLEGILKQILLPKIRAKRIQQCYPKIFDMAKGFLKEGQQLRNMPSDKFCYWCNYEGLEVEDRSIGLSGSGYHSAIPNPFYKDVVIKMLEEGFDLITKTPPHTGGGRDGVR